MKRVFLGLLLFVMLFIVSACTGKDTDRETEQLTEDTSTSFEPDTAMPIEDDAEETENQETEIRGIVVIPGSGNPDHIKENLDLFGFELTEDEMEQISVLDRGEKHDWY